MKLVQRQVAERRKSHDIWTDLIGPSGISKSGSEIAEIVVCRAPARVGRPVVVSFEAYRAIALQSGRPRMVHGDEQSAQIGMPHPIVGIEGDRDLKIG